MLQGTEEWYAIRCGMITASEMKHIITPKYKVANNAKTKLHLYELLAQRITKRVEPCYISDDMIRGMENEDFARALYNEKRPEAQAREVGFVTNDKWGFTLGFSPDGLVGHDGGIEIKCRNQKFQIQTISQWETPEEHDIQVHTGMLVAELEWLDYVQYSNGMPMPVIRARPDEAKQKAIIQASAEFEERLGDELAKYNANMVSKEEFLIKTKFREGGMLL